MTPSLVMQVEPYTITNKETGEIEREGATLTYFDLESPQIGKKRGYEPLRVSIGKEIVDGSLSSIPAYYNLTFRQRANRDTGKAEIQCTGMRYLSPWAPPDEAVSSYNTRTGVPVDAS